MMQYDIEMINAAQRAVGERIVCRLFPLVFFTVIVFGTLNQLVEDHGNGAQNENGSDHHA
jgi:hypothetical protein